MEGRERERERERRSTLKKNTHNMLGKQAREVWGGLGCGGVDGRVGLSGWVGVWAGWSGGWDCLGGFG